MSPQRINTLAELQAEQDLLQDGMRLTRKKFVESAAHTTATGKDFLLKNVLLPVGAIGLGAFVAKKVSDYADSKTELPEEVHAVLSKEESGNGWFSKLMLVALPFIQQFFLKEKSAEQAAENEAGETNYSSNGATANGASSLLATLVPIAIPLAQQYFLKRAEQSKEQAISVDVDGEGIVEGSFVKKDGASAIFESLYKLLPVVLPLVQQYFEQKNKAQQSQYAEATA